MGEIIDFHIHPFYRGESNVCFYNDTVNEYTQVFEDLKRAGITTACGSVIERMKIYSFEQIRQLNDEALKLRDEFGEMYIPGVHIHPDFVIQSCKELERMHNAGVKLVGELVPYFMGWRDYFDGNLYEIYKCIEDYNMVVSVHTQSEETLEEAVKTFPNIIFVGAHPGDKESYMRHIERIEKYDNYYMDLSGTGIFRYGMVGDAVRRVGSERILFGTDYPICNPQMYVQAVLYEKLKDKDYENIFANNAKRILGL